MTFVAAVVMTALLDVVLLGVTLGVVALVGAADAVVTPKIARATASRKPHAACRMPHADGTACQSVLRGTLSRTW
ncbi:hypothetical protein ACWGH3_25650 [Streptomyces sp. NPDC054884]